MTLRPRVFLCIMTMLSAVPISADAQELAVVAKSVIYPGQTIASGSVSIVDATNCPNCDPGYLQGVGDVEGMVAVRTLIPGKLIFANDIREPSAVMPGKDVAVIFRSGALQISMRAEPLAEAAIGQSVTVRNRETGATVIGVVNADGTVTVLP